MNLTTVRQGLATALDTISGLRVFDYVPDNAPAPAAIVEPLEVTYDQAMNNGLIKFKSYITIVVARMSDRSSQDRVDAYVDPTGATSVRAAIETDRTLGGACSTLNVIGAQPRSVTMAGVEYNAYRFEVDIYG